MRVVVQLRAEQNPQARRAELCRVPARRYRRCAMLRVMLTEASSADEVLNAAVAPQWQNFSTNTTSHQQTSWEPSKDPRKSVLDRLWTILSNWCKLLSPNKNYNLKSI